jgi:D-3-phosphoglycerate dehydrogenase
MKGKIAVTPRSLSQNGHSALDLLGSANYEIIFPTPGRQPTLEEQKIFLPQCVGYLAGVEQIGSDILHQCVDLKVISRNGIGVDNIDLEAAKELGIVVETVPGANSRGVAELTIALMLCGLRHVSWSDRQMKIGQWARKKGVEIQNRILGLIGCGYIGKLVVDMAIGLGMGTIAYDPYPDPSFRPGGNFRYTDLNEIYRESDVISLHCPPEGTPIINESAVASMKEGVYLINTARASLIDEATVLKALMDGKIRGIATDVYDREPPEMNQFLSHEKVITMPHAGGYTVESTERATRAAVENILKILEI